MRGCVGVRGCVDVRGCVVGSCKKMMMLFDR